MTEHLPQEKGGFILNSETTYPINFINLPLYRNNIFLNLICAHTVAEEAS